MPELYPFRAVRYAPGPLTKRIAPPYDVISPSARDDYAARDIYNIVHLILPKAKKDEADPLLKYQRAGETYRKWLEKGVLVRDVEPALYVLRQDFSWEGQRFTRKGFLARLRLVPFGQGVVLPHERTLSGPKVDRLHLFRAVKANLSPIFGLIPDLGEAQAELEPAGEPDVAVEGDDGVKNALWAVRHPSLLARVCAQLAPKKVVIADGHHRYETGLAYAAEVDAALPAPLPAGSVRAHQTILAYLCSTSDPGLLVLPTHRLIHRLAAFDADQLVSRLGEQFKVVALSNPAQLAAVRARLAEAGKRGPAFALVTKEGVRIVGLKEGLDLSGSPELPAHPTVRALDVAVLHGLVFQRLLGMSPESQEREENLTYVKDPREAFSAVETGRAQAAFLLNPTKIEQVRATAEAGQLMPQKSTFFYPKLPSGLLINPLDPEETVGA